MDIWGTEEFSEKAMFSGARRGGAGRCIVTPPPWQRVGADVDGGSCGLPHLLYLASLLADNCAALAGGDEQVELQPCRLLLPLPAPLPPVVPPLPTLQSLQDQGVRLQFHFISCA